MNRRRFLLGAGMFLLALAATAPNGSVRAQPVEAELDSLKQTYTYWLGDARIVYGRDRDGRAGLPRPRRCEDQRAPAQQGIYAFLTHPRIQAVVWSEWATNPQRAIGSFRGRQVYAARAVIARRLRDLFEEIGTYRGSSCPPRNDIRSLATDLYLLGREHIQIYPDITESPLDLIGYWQWLTENAPAADPGGRE
jgi:hypothetical protein